MARGRRIAADPSRPLWTALSLTLLVLGWAAIAAILQSRYLPSPAEVARLFVVELAAGDLLRNVAITLARVAAAALIAFVIGTAIGILLGRHRDADRFFDSWLIFFLNVPALITIVLCYLWIGLDEAAAITAVALNKIPNVAVTLREGARALDPQYDEMANVFRFDRLKRLRHVLLPQLEPYLAAAARSGLALIWKIVLVAELLGRSNGVGFQLGTYFQLFDVASILAYAIAFIAVVQLIEWGLLMPLERHLSRWRR